MRRLALAPTTAPAAPPLEFLAAARAARCEAVGLRLYPSPGFPYHPIVGDAALIREVKQRLAGEGIALLDLFTFYLQPACDFAAFARSLEIGAELGAKYALLQGDDPDRARLTEHFGRFCDLAAGYGLGALMEFNPARALGSLEAALRLVSDCARPNAAVCVDPLHLARSGGKPEQLKGVPANLMPYAQFSDGELEPPARPLPGQGVLPLREFLAALPAQAPLSVEVPLPAGSPCSVEAWVIRVMDTTRRYLAAIPA